jgi:CDP-glucose 4,6-dehydratase
MKKNFWKNKKVLITGHTGFKGSWLTLILKSLDAKIFGIALDPISKPNFFDGMNLGSFLKADYRNNIKNLSFMNKVIEKHRPEIIFHLAAQSSVLVSYKNPIDTVETNVIGTANILECIRKNKFVKSAIIVTTDKVYLNLEINKKFKENDQLGGYDMYSGSKAASEIIFKSYQNSFFNKNMANLATVRSGNCIGGGDWTEDRIMKDCAEKLIKNKKLIIRNPQATRPWQHVIEPLFGYLGLAKKIYEDRKYSGAWNFGPNKKNNLRVINLVKICKDNLKSKSKIIIKKNKLYESKNLSLNSNKSLKLLNWKTILNAENSIKFTLSWYKLYYETKSVKKIIQISMKQILEYQKLLKNEFHYK